MGYKIWVLAELYGYVVQFEIYQDTKTGKLVASSTKWGLRQPFVLQLMECLILTVSSDIIFEQQVCSTQIVYTNALSLGINTCKKINTPNLVSAHQEKSSGWLE